MYLIWREVKVTLLENRHCGLGKHAGWKTNLNLKRKPVCFVSLPVRYVDWVDATSSEGLL